MGWFGQWFGSAWYGHWFGYTAGGPSVPIETRGVRVRPRFGPRFGPHF